MEELPAHTNKYSDRQKSDLVDRRRHATRRYGILVDVLLQADRHMSYDYRPKSHAVSCFCRGSSICIDVYVSKLICNLIACSQ